MKMCSVKGCGGKLLARGWCGKHYARWRAHGDVDALLIASPGKPMEWLQAHVAFTSDDCLAWPFATHIDGYGVIRLNSRTVRVHRLMCILAHGEPARPKLHAAHSCGNGHKGCCNPRHLRWATMSENQLDRALHGTSNRGERCGSAVLTRADVMRIRSLAGVQRQRDLARHYGVAQATISKIVRGQRWSWLDEEQQRGGRLANNQ